MGNGDGGKARRRFKNAGFIACLRCGDKWNFKRNSCCFTCGGALPLADGAAARQPRGAWGTGGKGANAADTEKLRKENADLKEKLANAEKPKKEPETRVEKALAAVQALEVAKGTAGATAAWEQALAAAHNEVRDARGERDSKKSTWHRDSDLEQALAKKRAHLRAKEEANQAATKNFEEAKAWLETTAREAKAAKEAAEEAEKCLQDFRQNRAGGKAADLPGDTVEAHIAKLQTNLTGKCAGDKELQDALRNVMRRAQALEEQPRVASIAEKAREDDEVSDMDFDGILDDALQDESQAVFVNILLEDGASTNPAAAAGAAAGANTGAGKRQALEQLLQSQAKRTRGPGKPRSQQQPK